MRIIDKNKDFYDYFQDIYRDTSLTFDRTDSFLLTKGYLMSRLNVHYIRSFSNKEDIYSVNYLLLQVCNAFWLFAIQPTEVYEYYKVKDCDIHLLNTWKDYTKPRCLIKLEIIDPNHPFRLFYEKDEKKQLEILMQEILTNNYTVKNNYCCHKSYRQNKSDWIEEVKHIPLLKASGLSTYIEPLDIYLAFEEYFSLKKTTSERRESTGLTDKEKIENHGFDKKISFRG